MRFFVYIFIVFDVLVVLAGLFFIFEKTFRKIKVEHHYTFCPIKKDGMKGWALINDENKILCYSVKEGEENGNAVYRYKNRVTKLFSTHRVSQMLRNNKAPNFSRKSFYYDKDEIWNHLKKRGYFLQTTIIDDNITQYKIKRGSRVVAFARKRRDNDNKYTLRTYEKNLDGLFLVLFAIGLTEEKHTHNETEQINETAVRE